EPPIVEREQASYTEADQPWYSQRLPLLDGRARTRLAQLANHLGDADWLDGAFSAGDLMMVMVLRRAEVHGLLDAFPNLAAYLARGTSRPAYQRAFNAQYAVFAANHGTDADAPRRDVSP